jgi:fructose-1,6-bisphosphatase/inositol monophosphatase family enzyme
VIDPRHGHALETFLGVADAVGEVLRANTQWGASGLREGQYAIDLDADRACLDRLLTAGFSVLSEESGVQGPADRPMVVVDPLDGSTNASRGVPWFGTALCLVDADGPAVACVANHATGERFTAIRGHGAERDGAAISVSACETLADAIVGVSGLPDHHYGWAQFRALGASAPDICAVASGVFDAWCDMSRDAHGVWDYLASVLVVEEAGGVATEVDGRELVVLDTAARRTPAVAATRPLLDALLAERRRD